MNILKTQKKVLLLGGSFFQVPSVQAAKRLGYYTITCDYLPDNPGHKFADEYYNVSTTDMPAVLELAKTLKIDGIVCYASDPAAPTAAYVAEKLGLPGNPYDSVLTLSYKDKFRKFLLENGFRTPRSGGFERVEDVLNEIDLYKFPIMVKPVDSSGSKGVSKVESLDDLPKAFAYALEFSRCKRIIVEEFVPNNGPQVTGEGISHNGQLVFRAFGAQIFNKPEKGGSPFVPAGGSWPYDKPTSTHQAMHDEIQRALTLLEMRNCAYNFEVRLDVDENPILMEIGCRNGGNMIPQVLKFATGVDMVDFVIKSAVGDDCSEYGQVEPEGVWAYYVVHSNASGILKEISVAPEFRAKYLAEFWQIKRPGDEILAFTGAQGTLGTMALRFDSQQEAREILESAERFVDVVLE